MKLINVTIHKYKSFETSQLFSVDPSVTILVGKNESGKTAALESIAKTNYFTNDDDFKFKDTHDYPRKEKKQYDKSGDIGKAISCEYQFSDDEIKKIEETLGVGSFLSKSFSVTTKYDSKKTIESPNIDVKVFLAHISNKHKLDAAESQKISSLTNKDSVNSLLEAENEDFTQIKAQEVTKAQTESRAAKIISQPKIISALAEIKSYFVDLEWDNWLHAYVWIKYISPNLPKFMYFDEYHELPARININEIANGNITTQEKKTAKALLELADINTSEIISSSTFEDFVAELEATSSQITQHIFKYWKNNTGLRVQFHIEPGTSEKYLNIRVWSDKHHISLPLSNRSKGFNWFFSFIVWFSRIQEDKNSNYILLLDEPGLNLHASAQEDLLGFIEDLCSDYQIIYSTHSPFMVPSTSLHRVRTVYEGKNGSEISEAIQQKDSDTLFPLQAALGYDIAQNLFISKNNLLVEGPSDLIYLTMMSSILESVGKQGLNENLTIVPVGGLDKVTSFISLLRGQKLNIVCLLDTFTDQKGKKRLEDLIQLKIIKDKDVLFFDQFDALDSDTADLEDLFKKEEYLEFFNKAFNEFQDITLADIKEANKPILPQINKIIGKPRFNHYRPANIANNKGLIADDFSAETLLRFESVFKEINKRFSEG